MLFVFVFVWNSVRCAECFFEMTLHHFQERYKQWLTDRGIKAPAEPDFKEADLDGNEVLLYREWRAWVANQKQIAQNTEPKF